MENTANGLQNTVKNHDPKTGRFVPGNKVGANGKGTPKRHRLAKQETKDAYNNAVVTVTQKVYSSLDDVLDKLTEQAKSGNMAAISQLLKYLQPPKPRTTITNATELADIPLGQRLEVLGNALAEGVISVEEYEALAKASKDTLEYSILKPVKLALSSLRSGENVDSVLAKLGEVMVQLEDHTDVS